jgi:hypothetical protein
MAPGQPDAIEKMFHRHTGKDIISKCNFDPHITLGKNQPLNAGHAHDSVQWIDIQDMGAP